MITGQFCSRCILITSVLRLDVKNTDEKIINQYIIVYGYNVVNYNTY